MSFGTFLQNLGNSINAKMQEVFSTNPQESTPSFKGSIDASVFSNLDKDSFLDKIAKGMNLDSDDSIFYQNIDDFGVDKIFDYFDKDGDGVIEDDEIKEIAGQDNDDEDISGYDLYYATYEISANKLLDTYGSVGNNGLFDVPNIEGAYEPILGSFNPSASYYDNPSAGLSAPENSYVHSEAVKETNQDKLNKIENEEIPELEKKKQEVIDKAKEEIDAKYEKLNEKEKFIKEKQSKLQYNYLKKQDEIKECDDKIAELDSNISESEAQIHTQQSTVSNLEAELSALKTDTNDEKINESNRQRKSEIEGKIKEAKEKIAQEEEKIEGYKKDKEEQQTLKAQKQEELNQIQKEIEKQNPELAQKMQKIQDEIKSIEEKKTQDVQEIDNEIKVKREEAIGLQKQIGEAKGTAESGPFANYNAEKGQALASTAHTVRGTTGWCLAGVNDSLQNTEGFGQRLAFNGAYQAIEALQGKVAGYENLASNFQEVSVAKDQLPSLPAGAIVVWDQSAGHQWGHISIALGDGRESSDFIGPQMKDRDAEYHVFIPV